MKRVAQIGWMTAGFEEVTDSKGNGVGDDAFSWGFDGVRQKKWGNGYSDFGTKWYVGDFLGCAVDLSNTAPEGKPVSLSVNGSFDAPNCLAFQGIVADWVAPALTAQSQDDRYRVNFGDRPFKFCAPDVSYQSVHDFYLQSLHSAKEAQ